jgi:hypothetical protein
MAYSWSDDWYAHTLAAAAAMELCSQLEGCGIHHDGGAAEAAWLMPALEGLPAAPTFPLELGSGGAGMVAQPEPWMAFLSQQPAPEQTGAPSVKQGLDLTECPSAAKAAGSEALDDETTGPLSTPRIRFTMSALAPEFSPESPSQEYGSLMLPDVLPAAPAFPIDLCAGLPLSEWYPRMDASPEAAPEYPLPGGSLNLASQCSFPTPPATPAKVLNLSDILGTAASEASAEASGNSAATEQPSQEQPPQIQQPVLVPLSLSDALAAADEEDLTPAAALRACLGLSAKVPPPGLQHPDEVTDRKNDPGHFLLKLVKGGPTGGAETPTQSALESTVASDGDEAEQSRQVEDTEAAADLTPGERVKAKRSRRGGRGRGGAGEQTAAKAAAAKWHVGPAVPGRRAKNGERRSI